MFTKINITDDVYHAVVDPSFGYLDLNQFLLKSKLSVFINWI